MCFVAIAPLGYSQGVLNIVSQVTGFFRAPIYGPEPGNPWLSLTGQSAIGIPTGTTAYTGPLLTGTGYTFAVYYGAATVNDPSALVLLTTSTFRTGPASGLVTAQYGLIVPGIAPGEQARLQVRVWDNAGGTVTAYNSSIFRGQSAMFLSGVLGGFGTGGPILPPDIVGWSSFNIHSVIPEPNTFVLASLGVGALLLVRRKY